MATTITLEGAALRDLLRRLGAHDDVGILRVQFDARHGVSFKVNEGIWSPPYPAKVTT